MSQEDYVTLFRPSEYRQIKLALTINESTTLFWGYALGDVNVLIALDWSRNVFKGEQGQYPSAVVQVVYARKPRKSPYKDRNDIAIIETPDLSLFFEEFADARTAREKIERRNRRTVRNLAKELSSAESSNIGRFIDDRAYRTQVLTRVAKFSVYLVVDFMSFLDKCIAEPWRRSSPRGAFGGYD